MPLTITTTITPPPAPLDETPEQILELASERGDYEAGAGTPVAITIPRIRVDQTQLQYFTRNNNTEFMFNTGTLQLSMTQQVHISNALNPCSRTAWLQHEQHHVADNERIMGQMEAALRGNVEIQEILIRPRWQNITLFQSTQQTIGEVAFEIFVDKTERAARREDTRAEYRRVERQIRLRCGMHVAKRLSRGQIGKGIDLVQLALNNHPPTLFPLLSVDGIFGVLTERRVKEFQANNDLEDDGIVGPATRAALGL